MRSGLFITLEGGEGVGKTTNLRFIQQWLTDREVPMVTTREPGGTELGEQIRSLLLNPREQPVSVQTELLLIFAARAQHIAEVIRPSLKQGAWVLCDRFTDASYAYQGSGRELGQRKISELKSWVQEEFEPDRTFLFDAPVEVGMSRALQRGELDRFEQEDLVFFERVRYGYLELAKENADRIVVIDASGSLNRVESQLSHELEKLYGTWHWQYR